VKFTWLPATKTEWIHFPTEIKPAELTKVDERQLRCARLPVRRDLIHLEPRRAVARHARARACAAGGRRGRHVDAQVSRVADRLARAGLEADTRAGGDGRDARLAGRRGVELVASEGGRGDVGDRAIALEDGSVGYVD
jgi:hypothetical protein